MAPRLVVIRGIPVRGINITEGSVSATKKVERSFETFKALLAAELYRHVFIVIPEVLAVPRIPSSG